MAEEDSTKIGISHRPKKGVNILLVFSLLFAIGAGLFYGWIYLSDADGDGLNDECVESGGWFCHNSMATPLADACISISGVLLLVATVTYAIQQIGRQR